MTEALDISKKEEDEQASREKIKENVLKIFCIISILCFVYLWATKTQRLVTALEKADTKEKKIEFIGDLKNQNGDDVFNALIKTLNDDSPGVKATTIGALGALGDRRAIEPLVNMLKEDNPDIRYITCIALGKLKADEAVPDIINILKNDKAYSVRGAAAKSLAFIGDKRGLEPLCNSALNEEDEAAKLASIMALSSFQETQSFDTLVKLLEDDNGKNRGGAAKALGIQGDKRALSILESALKKETDDKVYMKINDAIERLKASEQN